jgi:hypothetical protein
VGILIDCRLYDMCKKSKATLLKKIKNDTYVCHFAWYLTVLFAVTDKIISDILRPNVIDMLFILLS